jgi:FAD/FMN-containing dehydrogenase
MDGYQTNILFFLKEMLPQACLEKNVLNLSQQDEISCQIIAEFKEHGLSFDDLLRIQKSLPLIYPWDKGYQSKRNNYNRKFSFFPMAIVLCRRTKDVQRAILFCRHYHLPFAVRSGGHSYLPFSLSINIVIDTGGMDKIEVVDHKQPVTKTRGHKYVKIGPGARLGKVAEVLGDYRLSIPLGSCVNVGAGGLFLGGGISPSGIRLGGISSDHLERAKIVLANGEVIEASKEKHADLLWALKGAGGGNFGIVTKFTFRPFPSKGAVAFTFSFRWEDLTRLIKQWQSHAPFMKVNLSSQLHLTPPKFSDLPLEMKGQFEGSLDEALRAFRYLTGEVTPVEKKVFFCPTFAECAKFWGQTRQTYFTANSVFWMNPISDDLCQRIGQHLLRAPGALDNIEMNAMRGNVLNYHSSFPWRKALFWSQQIGRTLDPNDLSLHTEWVTNLYQDMAKESSQGGISPSYINCPQADLTERGRYLPAYYGENVDELRRIKRKYDPDNIFKFSQSIPP